MQSVKEMNLNTNLSIVINGLYNIRHFIYESMMQPELFEQWFYSAAAVSHKLTVTQFHDQFSTAIRLAGLAKVKERLEACAVEEIEQDNKKSFMKRLFGEQMDVSSFYSGLMQNKTTGLQGFLREKNNERILQFLSDNLYKLNDAAACWQRYRDDTVSLLRLLKQSKVEIDKLTLQSNLSTLRTTQLQTKNQPTVIKPIINPDRPLIPPSAAPSNPPPDLTFVTKKMRRDFSLRDSTDTVKSFSDIENNELTPMAVKIPLLKHGATRARVVLEKPETFHIINNLFDALERRGVDKLVDINLAFMLYLYRSYKLYPLTNHFAILLKLDRFLLNSLVNASANEVELYCDIALASMPKEYVIGRGWLATMLSLQAQQAIEAYWIQYIELLKSHLVNHPNHRLQLLLSSFTKAAAEDEEVKTPEFPPTLQAVVIEPIVRTELPKTSMLRSKTYSVAIADYHQNYSLLSPPRVQRILKRSITAPADPRTMSTYEVTFDSENSAKRTRR